MINLSDGTKAELAEKLSQAIQIREKVYAEVNQKQQETYTIDREVAALQMLLGIKSDSPRVLGLADTAESEQPAGSYKASPGQYTKLRKY